MNFYLVVLILYLFGKISDYLSIDYTDLNTPIHLLVKHFAPQ